MVPNSNEVGYWIDLGANSKGKVIKVYNPDIKSWVKLTDATSEDAVAPFIGSNGNWWIDNRDTGIPASGKSPIIGENGNWWIFDPALNEYADTGATAYGKTAYEYAVDHGYTGTEEDFGRMLNEVPNAVKDAKQAVKDSKEVLQNPPKIVDGNWYIYDYAKDTYQDSGINAVGDAFVIVKTYPSIQAMQDDYNNPKVKKDGEWVKLPNYGVEEFPDAPSDGKTYGRKNKQWSEIIASNQYLDLATLFPNESGTLSDENYQKIVNAVNKGIITARIETDPDGFSPITINNSTETYSIITNSLAIGPNDRSILLTIITVIINKSDKTYTSVSNQQSLQNTGSGTKYLSDNGQYREINTISGNGVSEIAALSQSAYDGLTEKKNTTLYIITG